MSKKAANMSAPINPAGQKSDHGILILVIVLVVLFTFVLPIAIVLLVVFGVVKPLIDSGIEYVNSSSYGDSVGLAYSRSIKNIYNAYEDNAGVDRDDCEIFEDFVETKASGSNVSLCNNGSMTLAASQAGGRVEMVAFGEDNYVKLVFNEDFTKYYEIARLTKLSEDPSGDIKQIELLVPILMPSEGPSVDNGANDASEPADETPDEENIEETIYY